jgi:hypothetical protein
MVGRLKMLAFAVALSVGATAFGGTYVENFTVDPGWDQLNNHTGNGTDDGTQNYGFSNTGVTTGSPGEMGGFIQRDSSPANFYGWAMNVPLDPDTQSFSASGQVHLVSRQGGSGYYLGFFKGASSYGSGGDAATFAGINWGDSQNAQAMIFSNSGGRDRSGVDPAIPTGQTVPWSITWTAGGGSSEKGLLEVVVNGVPQAAGYGGDLPNLDPFTHFGVFAISADGDWGNFFMDNISVTGPGIPEPASLGLLSLGALSMLRRRRNA